MPPTAVRADADAHSHAPTALKLLIRLAMVGTIYRIANILVLISAALVAIESSFDSATVEEKAGALVGMMETLGADSMEKRAAASGVAGLIGGLVVKKAQDTVLTAGILGGAAVAGACYAGWVKPSQLEAAADTSYGYAKSLYERYVGAKMEEPKVALGETKVMAQNLYAKAPGIILGAGGGIVLGYMIG